LTQGWTTVNALNTKIELDNQIARGVKLELGTTFLPSIASKNAKLGLHYRQQAFHTRAFLDLFKGPTFTADAVFAYEGFLLGGDIGYDVMEGKMTKYATAVGYAQSEYSATIQAHNNFKTFSASYHHRVSPLLEVFPPSFVHADERPPERLLLIPRPPPVESPLKSPLNISSTKTPSSRFPPALNSMLI
jgi:voltage-dependent anion channel protein 2